MRTIFHACFALLLIDSINTQSSAEGIINRHQKHSHAPTDPPSTSSPSTTSPTFTSPAPTLSTVSPTSSSTGMPTTIAPSSTPPTTLTPTAHEVPPSYPPSFQPSSAPSAQPSKGLSLLRMFGRALAFLIFVVLSVLLFGACMAHRYRIYYALRGLWYTVLDMPCTRWIVQKMGLSNYHQAFDTGLNTVIFDNEMSEGLLLRETNG